MSPDELFGPTNIATAGVATLAVTVATNALCYLTGWARKWPAFLFALAVACLIVAVKNAPIWYEWIFALFNACLLFCSALGLNQIAVAAAPETASFAGEERFFTPWFRKH